MSWLIRNYNAHGPSCPTASASGGFNAFDNAWHLVSLVLTSSSAKLYVDGTQVGTCNVDCTATGKPFHLFFTNHIINPASMTVWNSLGAAGASYQVDYYRMWIPNAQYPSKIIRPKQSLPVLQVAYNTSMTYTFPTATVLWGAGMSDYCQGVKFEDYEPGSSTDFAGNYEQFPAGLAWNSGTRVLSGVTTDRKAGRIHLSATPAYVAGGSIGYVARGYIDVGPNITTTSLSATHGSAYSHDLYPECDCGTLVPKAVTCTGLPAGLSFDPATCLITGTPVSAGSSTLAVGVTNASSQVATKNVTLVVS